MTTDQQFLASLAAAEMDRLRQLPRTVIRVCGPLTADGPEGYERNARRLSDAEQVLERAGKAVWRFGDAEQHIQGKGFAHEDVMKHFHEPVLASGLITGAYFLPRWEQSTGARVERALCEQHAIPIYEFLESWFSEPPPALA